MINSKEFQNNTKTENIVHKMQLKNVNLLII